MVLSYVERGVGAGAIGGLAYGLYVAAVANPLVAHAESVAGTRRDPAAGGAGQPEPDPAVAHAGQHAGEHGHEHAAAAVSELTTAAVGVGSGVLWGVLLGAAFGLAFYLFEPALPGAGATKALVLAGAGFLTVSGVPWLVLPPAVPGVEQPVATQIRIAGYAALMAVGAAVSAASILAYRRTHSRGRVGRIAVAALPLLATAIALPLATPTVVATGGAPDALVVAFRGVVVLSQAALWAAIAASYGWLTARTATGGEESPELEPDGALSASA